MRSLILLATSAALAADLPPLGRISDDVTCVAEPAQSYALYLPSNYSADRTWPFAYERICEALDLDANQVRNRIANSGAVVRFPLPSVQSFNFAQSA